MYLLFNSHRFNSSIRVFTLYVVKLEIIFDNCSTLVEINLLKLFRSLVYVASETEGITIDFSFY